MPYVSSTLSAPASRRAREVAATGDPDSTRSAPSQPKPTALGIDETAAPRAGARPRAPSRISASATRKTHSASRPMTMRRTTAQRAARRGVAAAVMLRRRAAIRAKGAGSRSPWTPISSRSSASVVARGSSGSANRLITHLVDGGAAERAGDHRRGASGDDTRPLSSPSSIGRPCNRPSPPSIEGARRRRRGRLRCRSRWSAWAMSVS